MYGEIKKKNSCWAANCIGIQYIHSLVLSSYPMFATDVYNFHHPNRIRILMFWLPFSNHDLVRTHRFCIHLLDMLSPVTLLDECVPDKGLRSLFKKGTKYRLPSRIDFTKCRDIVEDALQTYCKRWSKSEGVGVHVLIDWKNEFLRIIDIRIDNFTKHPHFIKQPFSRSVKFENENGEITP